MAAALKEAGARGSLADPDWSSGPWEASCKTRLVRQRQPWDCGVACLAMVAGIDYEAALATFKLLGLARGARPLSSNFSQLRQALEAHSVVARMSRWKGWDSLAGMGVVKVKPKATPDQRNWHWVVAEAHAAYGYLVRDPSSPLVAFGDPPLSVLCQNFDYLEPAGNWIICAAARPI